MTQASRFIRHDACPECGSNDNLAVYTDHAYCFTSGCEYYERFDDDDGEGNGDRMSKPNSRKKELKVVASISPLPSEPQRPIQERGITAATINTYKVTVNEDEDSELEAIFPRFNENGEHVSNQLRYEGKNFKCEGNTQEAGLFGMNLFPAGGRYVTVTEGYYDTLSAFQMTGSRYANVGVMSASTAKREVVQNFEYLNSFGTVVINFDNDEPGQKAAKECAQLFAPGKVKILKLQKFKDANDYLMNKQGKAYTDEWYSAPTYMPDGLLLGNDPKLLDDIINYKEPESIPYPWEGLNKSTYGLRLGEFTLFMADTGIGKALALDTPIPTPSGWTTMGDLRPGDKVFDETGKPCSVVRVTEPMTDRICYDVIFDDGSVITADEEHNWFVYSKNERSKGKEGKVRTTAELLQGMMSNSQVGWSIPLSGPLEAEEEVLGIPPYTLGLWLGDGASASNLVYTDDEEVLQYIQQDGFDVEPTGAPYGYRVKGLRSLLKEYHLLGNKHIPEEYMRASYRQRLELVQGLLDSDGYYGHVGEFSSTNKRLAKSVRELLVSLGVKATINEGRAKLYGKDCGTKYRVSFTTRVPVFKLKRKADKLRTDKKQRATVTNRYIKEIKPVESVPVKCIEVDSPNHLYLCGESMIPTHNTTFMKEIEYQLLTDEELVERGYGVGFLHLEESKRDTALGLMSIHRNKPYHLPDTMKSNEELQEVYNEIINTDRVVMYDHFGSNDIDIILAKIRHMAALGCRYIMLDHLSIIVSDQSGGDERKQLDEISTKLKTLTMNLHICVVAVIHINRKGEARGSAGPEQVSNNVIRLERDKRETDEWRRNVTRIVVEKCRLSGRTGPACYVWYNSMTGRLQELTPEEVQRFEEGGNNSGHEFEAYSGGG